MIIATAGHIDHGKTTLVKALTGVDTDRLPEEKKRGLSIDLGFAYVPETSGTLGFVDVPGHERFVRNMIAGVTAIDCAMLVIAADDGPMPQTREHLAILDLLDVKSGVVALTKIDRVEPERIEQVKAEIAELLQGTCLGQARIFPLATPTGLGVVELRQWLEETASKQDLATTEGQFRMAIDRAFVIDGAGLVVTGAVSSGEVRTDDRLVLSPGGIEVRVRGIHAQNRKAQQGRAGERCAINIIAPRLSTESVRRGDWLLAPGIHAPTLRFDARIRTLKSENRALRHWSPVHVHAGAADISARVAILEGGSIAPGGERLAQIILQAPASLLFGERIILRDQSGQRTIGGGVVIDPFAQARGRAKPQRLKLLKAMDIADNVTALSTAIQASPAGFPFGQFVCARNLNPANADVLGRKITGMRLVGAGHNSIAFVGQQWTEHLAALCALVGKADQQASADGVSRQRLQHAMRKQISDIVLEAMLQELVANGALAVSGGGYKLRGTSLQLDPKDAAFWGKLEKLLDNCRPPSISELCAEIKIDQRSVEKLLQKVARMGRAVQIAPNRYYLPLRLRELAGFAEDVAKETVGGLVSIRAFRDKSGVGRNLSVEALEFFDRLGFTGRSGEHRRIVKPINDVKWVRSSG